MKSILFFSFFCLCLLPLQAQDIVATLELGSKEPKPDFIEYSPKDEGIVTMGPMSNASSRNIGIIKYSSTLKREWVKSIVEQNGYRKVEFMTVIGGTILVFVSEVFPKDKVIKVFYYRYDLKGKMLESEEVLAEYPNSVENKVEFQYELSPNKKYLLCYKNLMNKKADEKVISYLFDESGNLSQANNIQYPHPDDKITITDVRVSNDGNIYTLAQIFYTHKSGDFRYAFYRYMRNTGENEEVEVDLEGKYVTDLAFRVDKDDNVYLAGFYSLRSAENIIGTLYRKIDSLGRDVVSSTEPFATNFLSNFLSSRQIAKGKELSDFYLNDICLRSDGGVMLLAERSYITSQSYQDYYTGYTTRNIYHYEEVIAISVSPEGKIEWENFIDKNQVSEQPAMLSYFSAVSAQGVYVFYQYNPSRKGTNVYYHTFDVEGNASDRAPLFPEYNYANEFYPRYCQQISNNMVLIPYFRRMGKELVIVKVKI